MGELSLSTGQQTAVGFPQEAILGRSAGFPIAGDLTGNARVNLTNLKCSALRPLKATFTPADLSLFFEEWHKI